jgi:cellulose synthase/poly-beta-1,6-N-acetylglucosamine synthase-like glycosyltransferase
MNGAPTGPAVPIEAPAGNFPSLAEPPTIAVVVPAFEAAATVAETIDSILAQESPPAQLVVVDDGSSDGLGEALVPYAGRIDVAVEPHRGVAAARNTGWRRCSADFILFVDADDVLLPGKVAALRRLGQTRPDLDLLATDMYFERDGARAGRFGDANSFPTERQRETILERCFVVQPAFRRSALERVGGFDESLNTAEDWDCALRLILSGSSAGLYDEPLAVYRIHPGSLTERRPETFGDRARIIAKAAASSDLRPSERRTALRSLAVQRRRAAVAAAQAAVRQRRRGARRLCLRLAATRGTGLSTRLWALACALLPAAARPAPGRLSRDGSQLTRLLPGQGRR